MYVYIYIYIYIYIYEDFLHFLRCFLCGKLTETCHCVRIALKVSQQSVASIINKHYKILINRLYVGTAVHSGTQRLHFGIGVAGYTFRSSIQA